MECFRGQPSMLEKAIDFLLMHGLKKYRKGWADGPAYVTQCPILTRHSYIYDIDVTGQRGTLWWHAHILWLRATVYGAIVILPKKGTPYPFPQPDFKYNLVLGEWLNDDVEEIENKETNSDCLQKPRMHTRSMENPGRSSHVPKNVSL
ncbi:hypothetical protein ACS0TY_003742 [Phlomoides rotata]